MEDTGYVLVQLAKPRTYRIVVLREDTGGGPPVVVNPSSTTILSRRGTAEVVELRAGENDVLHALAKSGGLPGEDAANEVWVLRGMSAEGDVLARLQGGTGMTEMTDGECQASVIRIPLRVAVDACPETPFESPGHAHLPLTPEEVALNDGDVVVVQARTNEFFYTGGLLTASKLPIPRDHDLDVMGAVAMGNGSLGGPAGINSAALQFRAGPGNIIPPSRVLIIRRVAPDQQLVIRVDLKKAFHDPSERINIAPEDIVLLKYKPWELLGNVALNFITFNFVVPNGT
jgi:hypothetical protein